MSHRVLVIDDDEIAREVMCDLLRRAGETVFELPSPIGASTTISRNDIQVLVLDINMPTMSGDKLAKLLRDNERFADLGIVLVSGCEVEKLKDISTRVSANAVVAKEAIHRDLVPSVRKVGRSFELAHRTKQ